MGDGHSYFKYKRYHGIKNLFGSKIDDEDFVGDYNGDPVEMAYLHIGL